MNNSLHLMTTHRLADLCQILLPQPAFRNLFADISSPDAIGRNIFVGDCYNITADDIALDIVIRAEKRGQERKGDRLLFLSLLFRPPDRPDGRFKSEYLADPGLPARTAERRSSVHALLHSFLLSVCYWGVHILCPLCRQFQWQLIQQAGFWFLQPFVM